MDSNRIAKRAGRPGGGRASPGRAWAVARDLLFLAALGVYILVVGQNWAIYSAALMIAAYRSAFRAPGATGAGA